jgi:hypothetical protein
VSCPLREAISAVNASCREARGKIRRQSTVVVRGYGKVGFDMGESERWNRWNRGESTRDNAEKRTDTKKILESTRDRSPIFPLSTSHTAKDVKKLTSFD